MVHPLFHKVVIDGSSYAMINLSLVGNEIDDLGDLMRPLVNVRYLDLSENLLKDIGEVVYLPNLLKLNASKNLIQNAKFLDTSKPFKFLLVRILKNQ